MSRDEDAGLAHDFKLLQEGLVPKNNLLDLALPKYLVGKLPDLIPVQDQSSLVPLENDDVPLFELYAIGSGNNSAPDLSIESPLKHVERLTTNYCIAKADIAQLCNCVLKRHIGSGKPSSDGKNVALPVGPV
eukprot:CAMPEP_0114146214 /NCGR_PEP_ID=MMETSP0043_2-20121206/20446_1 /TAXON_ID=464988 /ORGANISM="Hemiselmis andersenii, Strain CCMP644" /LENGTH=131 /DNA_ID=CAMNT_0001240655 /DNA_START=246 /DNA_END=641 /DNA_ORIENTATION=-